MDRFFGFKLPQFSRNIALVLLAFFWCAGLVFGVVCAAVAGESLLALMRTAVSGHASIASLLMAILLPFLFSAFAVYLHEYWLFMPTAFIKAFLFSYVGFGVMTAFNSAGWLVRAFFMFGDCCTLPLLYWFWISHLTMRRRRIFSITVPLLLALVIGGFEFYVVSPFLAVLIS